MNESSLSLAVPPELVELVAARAAELVEDRERQAAEPWLDVEEAALYIAAKRQRVYDLVSQGRLRHCREGRRLLFRREWLDGCLEEATIA